MTQGRKISAFGREYQDLPTRRVEQGPGHSRSSYRDRRRFCGGHEGREHVWTMGRTYGLLLRMKPFHSEVCADCGKKRYRDGAVMA